MPLPTQIAIVVKQEFDKKLNSGSIAIDTAHIIRKYAAPANIPHKKRLFLAPLEKKSPDNKEDIIYTTTIPISTVFSLSCSLYSSTARDASISPVTIYAANKHFNNAIILSYLIISLNPPKILFFVYCFLYLTLI